MNHWDQLFTVKVMSAVLLVVGYVYLGSQFWSYTHGPRLLRFTATLFWPITLGLWMYQTKDQQ